MNAGALHKRLLQDMRRNPKKAVLLALLLGAALYFWVPLLGGLFGDEPDSAAAAPPTAVPATAAPQGSKPTADKQPDFDWRQLARCMEQDRRMLPAMEDTLARDPFVAVRPQAAPTADGRKKASAAPTPQKLGVRLTAIVVGGGRRLALIGGVPYEQGQTVELGGYEFTLIQVGGRGIVLGRSGKQYRIELPDAEPIGK